MEVNAATSTSTSTATATAVTVTVTVVPPVESPQVEIGRTEMVVHDIQHDSDAMPVGGSDEALQRDWAFHTEVDEMIQAVGSIVERSGSCRVCSTTALPVSTTNRYSAPDAHVGAVCHQPPPTPSSSHVRLPSSPLWVSSKRRTLIAAAFGAHTLQVAVESTHEHPGRISPFVHISVSDPVAEGEQCSDRMRNVQASYRASAHAQTPRLDLVGRRCLKVRRTGNTTAANRCATDRRERM